MKSIKSVKKTGKTVLKYLQKRGISGDDLRYMSFTQISWLGLEAYCRREMWVHDEAETPKAGRKKKGKGYDIS